MHSWQPAPVSFLCQCNSHAADDRYYFPTFSKENRDFLREFRRGVYPSTLARSVRYGSREDSGRRSKRAMRQNHSSLETASTEENTPSVQDLCKAMFLEGARLLGFPSARLPLKLRRRLWRQPELWPRNSRFCWTCNAKRANRNW